MENDVSVNGFSQVSEKELREVDGGGFPWIPVIFAASFVIGLFIGLFTRKK